MFEEVRLKWKEKEYVIPENRVMRLIAKVEDVITLAELINYSERNTTPVAKVASAYGVMLRFAGARVEDEEIYSQFYDAGAETIIESTFALLAIMSPKNLTKREESNADLGK